MSVIEIRFPGFLKVVGVIAALLAGALIFHLTRSSPGHGAIAPTEFDGFVADAASRQLLRNAEIRVELGRDSAEQKTDTFGRYSMVFPSPQAEASTATVEIHAAGYGDYKNTILLRPGSNYAEIMLSAVSPAMSPEAAAEEGEAEHTPPKPPAQVFVKSMPPDFMKANTMYVATSRK